MFKSLAFSCLDSGLLVYIGDKWLSTCPCVSPKPAPPPPSLGFLKMIYSNSWKNNSSNLWVGMLRARGLKPWRYWHKNDINCPWRPAVSNTRFIAAVMERHAHSPERRRRYWGRSGTESDHGKIWSPGIRSPLEPGLCLWEVGTASFSPFLMFCT